MAAIEDRLAVIDLMSAYTAGIDSRDWDSWRALFTDPLTWDFESAGLGPAYETTPKAHADFMASGFASFIATHHAATNHRVTLDGDRARIQAHIHAEHWVAPELVAPKDNCWLVTGFYDDQAVRTPEGWRLARVRLTINYQQGDHVRAAARAAREARERTS